MTFDEEYQIFRQWLNDRFPGAVIRITKGASNGPFVLENCFKLGIFNFENTDFTGPRTSNRAFCLVARLVLPPRNVLHIALIYQADSLKRLEERRDEIMNSSRANNVRVYIHRLGVFLRQVSRQVSNDESDFNAIDPSDITFGLPVPPTAAFFADTQRSGHLDPVEISYIDHLGRLLQPLPFVRLGASRSIGGARLDPREVDVGSVVQRIANLGGVFPPSTVHRYHVALNHLSRKHFALLVGISGTGKTLLAKAYAYAILGEADLEVSSEDVFLIPVRPDWTDPSHLLGYYDVVTATYRHTRFLDALLRASENRDRPVFVCLDEMNLAQPDHYFADIMSAMESGEDIVLHDFGTHAGAPQRVAWPNNLYITGTVNVDETTRPFSPKLLDRANVIDLSEINLHAFIESLVSREPQFQNVFTDDTRADLQNLHAELAPYGLHFGYRSVVELAHYLAFSYDRQVLLEEALDIQIEQKILPKLRGGIEQGPMLTRIKDHLERHPRSKAVVERMIRDLEAYSSFQYWT